MSRNLIGAICGVVGMSLLFSHDTYVAIGVLLVAVQISMYINDK